MTATDDERRPVVGLGVRVSTTGPVVASGAGGPVEAALLARVEAAEAEAGRLRGELDAARTWQAKRLVAISQDPMCIKWMREAEQLALDCESYEAEVERLRGVVQAVEAELRTAENTVFGDQAEGAWHVIDRVRAALADPVGLPTEPQED